MLKKQKKLILTEEQQDSMRRAGRVNAQLMDFLRPQVRPGVTTLEIDQMVHQWTMDHGHKPATLGYQNYPKSCCTSVNDVICHGIPDDYQLKLGDIVNVDITTEFNRRFHVYNSFLAVTHGSQVPLGHFPGIRMTIFDFVIARINLLPIFIACASGSLEFIWGELA